MLRILCLFTKLVKIILSKTSYLTEIDKINNLVSNMCIYMYELYTMQNILNGYIRKVTTNSCTKLKWQYF